MHSRSRTLRSLIAATGLVLASAITSAQSGHLLLREGDELFGAGVIIDIVRLEVNDNGEWMALVDTTEAERVLLRNGIPILQTGDELSQPLGASVGTMDYPSFNVHGDVAWVINLLGIVNEDHDSGLYNRSILLAQEGRISTASNLTPGTTWAQFFNAVVSGEREVLVIGQVDDPGVTGELDDVLMRVMLDEDGYLLGEESLVIESDPISGVEGVFVTELSDVRHSIAFNNEGDWITWVDTGAPAASDGFILLNGDPILREGDPSPIAGRNWQNLRNPRLGLNDRRDWVIQATLSGTAAGNLVLVSNHEKVMQEGDIPSSVAPWAIENFGSAGVEISSAGNVFWFGQFSDVNPDTDRGYFMNDQVLVRSARTIADGILITDCKNSGRPFAVSPNGRFYTFIGVTNDGTDAGFLMDLGLLTPMSGCAENEGTLDHASGFPLVGEQLGFAMDGGQATGVTPLLAISTSPTPGWPEQCGPWFGGELLLDVNAATGNPVLTQFGPTWGGAPVSFFVDIPEDPALIGATLYAQGLFWDLGDMLPEPNFRLTNGLLIQLSAP